MDQRTIFERWLQITARFGHAGLHGKFATDEPPLRSMLFSADQMEQHGKSLALAHRLVPGRARDQLLVAAGRERRRSWRTSATC